jgi:hypothetical protein
MVVQEQITGTAAFGAMDIGMVMISNMIRPSHLQMTQGRSLVALVITRLLCNNLIYWCLASV